MDFSDALKALKEGKKVRRSTWANKEAHLIYENEQRTLLIGHSMKDYSKYTLFFTCDLLADDWEIVEPKKVPVKTKTVEYIMCSKCDKEIIVGNKNDRVMCEECKNEMVLERFANKIYLGEGITFTYEDRPFHIKL